MASWELAAADLPDLARGATLLGTGGGGDPYIGRLLVSSALGHDGAITMLDPDEVDDDALVIPTAMMGAPTIMLEKISHGSEAVLALRTLEDRIGEKAQATMPIECGGINSMMPLFVAASTGLPCVDADGMGRAFPELQMETFYVYGVSSCPMAIAAPDGSTVVIDTGMDAHTMEWISRGGQHHVRVTQFEPNHDLAEILPSWVKVELSADEVHVIASRAVLALADRPLDVPVRVLDLAQGRAGPRLQHRQERRYRTGHAEPLTLAGEVPGPPGITGPVRVHAAHRQQPRAQGVAVGVAGEFQRHAQVVDGLLAVTVQAAYLGEQPTRSRHRER